MQIERLISDAESEKENRRLRNKDHDDRLYKLEQWQAKWAGGLIAVSIICTILSIIAVSISLFKN